MNATSLPVLITGASTGIGYHLTHSRAKRGCQVFAGARKEKDLDDLGQIENVIPVELDVRDPQQIVSAVEVVESNGQGLYGLVNNAGLGGLGLLSTWTDAEMLEIFDVNVFGPHRLTNAFIQMLVANKGRVVNISSQGGMITSKYYGPYTMTKHALEAYTVALSMELEHYGVSVSVIQPGGIISNVGANAFPGTLARFQRAVDPFKDEAEAVLESFSQPPPEFPEDEPESATNRKPSSPEIVSVAVYDALFSEKPKLRYLVGTKWEGDRVINALIEKLLDENDNPMHGYSREELVAILDRHVIRRQPE